MPGHAVSRTKRAVSPLELLYDVIFIFAVSQLAHHLLEHLTWRGAAETGVLLVSVIGTWAFTSFGATLLDIDRPRTRLMVVVAMGLGLFMNAAISRAFGGGPWAFVVPMLLILLVVPAIGALLSPGPEMRRHYQRVLVWHAVATPLWIAGALAAPGPRLAWWGAAALIDLLGTLLAHPLPGRVFHSASVVFDAGHMLERLRLFLIIMLGETILTVGPAVADAPVDVPTVAGTTGVFVALVCLWGSYFGGGEDVIARHLATTRDPLRSVRLAINTTYATLTGLVLFAVGSELVIAHPLGHGSTPVALLLFGGTLLYLGAQAWYYRATIGRAWRERAVLCLVFALAGLAAPLLPPLAALALLNALLIPTAFTLARTHRRTATILTATRP
ncbi:low temperature requirement protein A [Actinocorallia sp. API 0066]|uniref:low temperature requirement protein A n=1 Tax=Actinocorallia sp. API 0066 TaxID=2896846 RepID=UPI001E382869|nr:low temperature requirement protein A [Actinocorallia sp. API 0066]MCD0449127.1 low temperature requirement protein A [Actinocorallia sp. API 0066]